MPTKTLEILFILLSIALYLVLRIWCELNNQKEIVEDDDER